MTRNEALGLLQAECNRWGKTGIVYYWNRKFYGGERSDVMYSTIYEPLKDIAIRSKNEGFAILAIAKPEA